VPFADGASSPKASEGVPPPQILPRPPVAPGNRIGALKPDVVAVILENESRSRASVREMELWVRDWWVRLARIVLSARPSGVLNIPTILTVRDSDSAPIPPRPGTQPLDAAYTRRLTKMEDTVKMEDIGKPISVEPSPARAVPRLALEHVPKPYPVREHSPSVPRAEDEVTVSGSEVGGSEISGMGSLARRAAAASARAASTPLLSYRSLQPASIPASAKATPRGLSPALDVLPPPPLSRPSHPLVGSAPPPAYSIATPAASPERSRPQGVLRAVIVGNSSISRQVLAVVMKGLKAEVELCDVQSEFVRKACLSRGHAGPVQLVVIDTTSCSVSDACSAVSSAKDATGNLCQVVAVLPSGEAISSEYRTQLIQCGCEEEGFIFSPPLRRDVGRALARLGAIELDST